MEHCVVSDVAELGWPRLPMRQGSFEEGPAAEWLRKSSRDYERVLQEMNLVSEQSRRMNGNAWYLFLHYRKATGQRFLQWRSFGTPHVHMTWDRITPVVQTLGEAQRKWFEDANERAEVLNAREQVARRAVQMAQGIVAAVPG